MTSLQLAQLRDAKVVGVAGRCREHKLPHQVLEFVAAKEHSEKFCSVHEVDVQRLVSMCIIPRPQLLVAQHLLPHFFLIYFRQTVSIECSPMSAR